MAKRRNIIVRGTQRTDIDAALLTQALLAIAAEWERDEQPLPSPDTFEAAIEDRQVDDPPRRRAG